MKVIKIISSSMAVCTYTRHCTTLLTTVEASARECLVLIPKEIAWLLYRVSRIFEPIVSTLLLAMRYCSSSCCFCRAGAALATEDP